MALLKDFRIHPLTEQGKNLAINKVIEDINKRYGKGSLVRGADARGLMVNRLKTGSISLDVATGGGWPCGRLNEIYGPYCLDGDSIINYHLPHWADKRGKPRRRPKTISQLFKISLKNKEIYIESVDEQTNEVILNRVKQVVCLGVKPLYKITTEHGFTLNSTRKHYYKTINGYRELEDLKIGSVIAVADKRKSFNKSKERAKKGISLVYEAAMNDMSFQRYYYTNNRLDNLELMPPEQRGKLHSYGGHFSKTMLWDTITSIEYVGDKMTYDIAMIAPNNNFIANNVVVHNSGGKSFVSMLTMAQTQKDYPNANVALIDFEGAFDADWAKKIGVDVDKLLISSPEYMEDGLQIALDLIHSQDCILVVIDSLGAACPKAEYDGDIVDFTVGLRARVGNKFVRKSKGHVNLLDDNFDLGQTTILILNQEYQGIGPYSTFETPGGVQVKFGSMIRVRIRKGEVLNDTKDGTQIMQESRFTVVKNKTYPPHKTGAFWFSTQDNPKGSAGQIYRAGEILTQGILSGVISRSGSWFQLPAEISNEKFQGEAKVADWIQEHPKEYALLEEMVMQSILGPEK